MAKRVDLGKVSLAAANRKAVVTGTEERLEAGEVESRGADMAASSAAALTVSVGGAMVVRVGATAKRILVEVIEVEVQALGAKPHAATVVRLVVVDATVAVAGAEVALEMAQEAGRMETA
jgi:hypothetical protein